MFDIKRFRHEKKMTQIQLAEILSREQGFISAMELGKSPVPRAVVDILCELYGDEIDKYRSNPSSDIIMSDNVSTKDLLGLINKYEERLDKKDAQIDELTSMLRTEVEAIKSNLKNLEKQSVQQEDDVVCANAG